MMGCSSGSKSTDKLDILMDGLGKWPAEAFTRIEAASITWEQVIDVVVPVFNISFYEKA